MKLLISLFLNFCYIGLLSFGGGYASLPLIQQQCIELNGWLTMSEFSDLLTISQITPGPIAINAATFVGMKAGGVAGGFVASLGFMLPPFLIVSLLFWLFKKYGNLNMMQDILSVLKPAVVGLIAVAAMNVLVESLWGEGAIALATTDVFSAVLALCAFIVVRKWKTGVITTILSCGAVGLVWEFVSRAFS